MKDLVLKGKRKLSVTEDARVRIADRARATLIITPQKDADIAVDVGKHCTVDCLVIQQRGAKLVQTNRIGERSVMKNFSLWLHEGSGRSSISLEGDHAEAKDVHILVYGDRERFRLDSLLRHAAKDTKGDVLVKGVMKDYASAEIEGMIKVEKNGPGAESFLAQHMMLLSPHAHAMARPELEIENNDVSSRHAASVSQIDESKLFYLMSRGLNSKDARQAVVAGFLASAVERIEDPGMKQEIERLLAAAL